MKIYTVYFPNNNHENILMQMKFLSTMEKNKKEKNLLVAHERMIKFHKFN